MLAERPGLRLGRFCVNVAFILAKKVKMSQVWKGDKVIPITVLSAEPNKVALVRTKEKDGYEAVQLALGKRKREFRVKDPSSAKASAGKQESSLKAGDMVDVSVFKEGDVVRVSGSSKGRGFQGVVKRHGFAGGPKTHGQKNRFRAPGSIGSTAFQRVVPGRRMAGHMGDVRVTVKGLKVASVDKEKNQILLKGAVPGARGGIVEIQKMR